MSRGQVPRASAATALGCLVLTLASVLAAHYVLTRLPGGAELATGLWHRTKDLAVLSLLLAGAWAVGATALRRWAGEPEPTAYHATISIGLGLIYHSTAVILLAVMQLITTWTLAVVVTLPLLLLWRDRPHIGAVAKAIASAGFRLTPIGVVGLLAGVLYIVYALSPPVWPDELTYHLAIPREYLQNGGVPRDDGNYFRNFPTAFSMVYLILMGLGSDFLPKILHAIFALMTVVVAYHHFRRGGALRVASQATLLFACQWSVQHGIQRANVDFQFTFYGLTAFLLLAEAVGEEGASPFRRSWPVIAGLFLGAAVAGKIHALACVTGTAAVLIYLGMRRRLRWREAVVMGAVASLVYLPLLLRNLLYFFDPFVFSVADRLGWDIGVNPVEAERFRALASVKPIFMTAPGFVTFALTPLFAYTDGAFPTTTFDGFLDPLYLAGVPLGILLLRRSTFMKSIYVYLLGFYCGWFLTTPLTRYALPVLPLLGFITVTSFDHVAELAAEKWRATLRRIFAALIVMLCVFNLLSLLVSSPFSLGYGALTFFELMDRRQFAASVNASTSGTIDLGSRIVSLERQEGRTDRNQRHGVFMVFASQSYDLDVRYYNDPFYVNIGLLQKFADEGRDPISWLHERGYGYVLVEYSRIPWLLGKVHRNPFLNPYPEGLATLKANLDFFRQKIEPHLEPVAREGGLALYKIGPSAR